MGDWLSSLMDAFSNGWGDLSGFLGGGLGNPNQSGLASILQLMGIGEGAYGAAQQQDQLSSILGNQNRAINTAMDPAKMNALIQKYLQPLTATQNRAVLGPVEQAAAARGQNMSPGNMQIVSEQALAPYAQNEQQMALDAAFRSLGLPFQQSTPTPQYPGFNPVGERGPSFNFGSGSAFNPWADSSTADFSQLFNPSMSIGNMKNLSNVFDQFSSDPFAAIGGGGF